MSSDDESEIKRELRSLNDKFDRFLIGRDGTDGVLPRMSRIESRMSAHATILAWIAGTVVAGVSAAVFAIINFILPGWMEKQ